MSLQILNTSAWREFRGKPTNAGINETTHMAKIADESGMLHDCFVKLLPLDSPALLCEAIGWLLARSSNLSCATFGAVVLVPVPELRKCFALPNKFDGMPYCPAWCSEVVAGKSVRQLHTWDFLLKFALTKCLQSKDARKIAAFDQWGDLRDRNLGNVIKSGSGRYFAIDHETLLHDMLWLPSGRSFEERSLLVQAQTTLSTFEYKRFQMDMADAAKVHVKALNDAKTDLADVIAKIYPNHAEAINIAVVEMLSIRAPLEWMSNRLGVIS